MARFLEGYNLESCIMTGDEQTEVTQRLTIMAWEYFQKMIVFVENSQAFGATLQMIIFLA